ncbi:MAG TPA: ribosome maturation protein RimP [Allosphingosinicella sp.]|jgi:ribosome maturation factor RimP
MADLEALQNMFGPAAEAEGLALVRVKMIGGTSDPTLQVMAEEPKTRQLTLDGCARLSRRLSELLDAAEAEGRDPIPHAYRLEVSSPGIDRPLTRLKDYDDWKGFEARIVLLEKLDGRKVFSGPLLGVEGETVMVELPGQDAVGLPFASIQSAKLVMTDKLIAATAPLLAAEADAADEIVTFEGEPEDGAETTKTEED